MQLSPSVKLVFKILEYKGLMTRRILLQKATFRPHCSICSNYVEKRRILEERLYYKDARQCLYGVRTPEQDELLSNFACGMV